MRKPNAEHSKKMQGKYISWAAIILSILLLASSIIITGFPDIKDRIHFPAKSLDASFDGWYYYEGTDKVPASPLPYNVTGAKADFYNIIPEGYNTGYVMSFDNSYQYIKVYIDGQLVYQYQKDKENPRFMPSKIRCFVDILPEYCGKEVRISIKSDSLSPYSKLSPVWLQTPKEAVNTLFIENIRPFLFFIMIGGLGIAMLIGFLILCRQKSQNRPDFYMLLYLALFILDSAIWVFTDSGLPQFFFGNSLLVMVVSFEAFLLLPLPLLAFIRTFSGSQNSFGKLQWLCVLNFIAQNLLYIFGAANFMRMLLLTHAILLLNIAYGAVYMCVELYHSRSLYAKWTLIGLGLFVGISCLSLVSFYKTKGNDNSRFFTLGFTIFIIILMLLMFRRFLGISEESAKSAVYQELAYKDILTGLGNRTAYEEKLETLDDIILLNQNTAVIMLDIDKLKIVNDTWGHREGDSLIRDAAECIWNAYGDIGDCYRVGGDEFIVILKNCTLTPDTYRVNLETSIQACNASRNIPLSISSGFAQKPEDLPEITIRSLISMADQQMYQHKHKGASDKPDF